MGLGNFIKKKIEGSPEDRAKRQKLNSDVKAAKWESYSKGRVDRARKEGYAQGKSPGLSLGGLEIVGGIGGGPGFSVDPYANPFGGSSPRRSARSHRKSGTTIKVNGVIITVHNKHKTTHMRQRNSNPFY